MSVKADLRNIATIERLCKQIEQQCAFYRRNCEKGDDSARFTLIFADAVKLRDAASYGAKRWIKGLK